MNSPSQDRGSALAAGEFGTFYSSTLAPLRGYLARLLGSPTEAEDIAQDAYVRTYLAMEGQSVRRPEAFLFTTARNLARTFHVRRGSRMQPTEASILDRESHPGPGVVETMQEREDHQAFETAIAGLPPMCRQVLILRLKENLSHGEIAARLEISLSTVAKHLTRAFSELRDFSPGVEGQPRTNKRSKT